LFCVSLKHGLFVWGKNIVYCKCLEMKCARKYINPKRMKWISNVGYHVTITSLFQSLNIIMIV
jgi:hypothetical protein